MNPDEEAMWSSHLPALVTCVSNTYGPVCELGMGNFSTPLLHGMCVSQKRTLVSLESDVNWMNRFINMKSMYHEIGLSDRTDPYPNTRWSVVFLDQSREFWTRADSFRVFVENADFIVCHDFHRENEEEMRGLLSGLRVHVTRRQEPPTLICSKTKEIPSGLLDL